MNLYIHTHIHPDYVAVIEPSVAMHLDVFNDADSSTNKFGYSVCISDASSPCQHGVKYDSNPGMASYITFDCNPGDTFLVSVYEYDTGIKYKIFI